MLRRRNRNRPSSPSPKIGNLLNSMNSKLSQFDEWLFTLTMDIMIIPVDHRYGSIWATLGLPKKFTPWSFESFSHFFLDFSKKKAKIFEI